jgi:hypothetical protein
MNSATGQSLAVYNETRLEGRRRFELLEDGVHVSAQISLGPSIETIVRYDHLEPTISTIRIHHALFWPSFFVIPLFVAATVYVQGFSKVNSFGFLAGVAISGTIISVVVAVLTRKRVEYARFVSRSGIALLDIARSGPDHSRFDQFVAAIQDRIRSARSMAGSP